MVSKLNRPKVIITHHTGGTNVNPLADTSNHTVSNINAWHKQQWPDFVSTLGYNCGYHFVIEKNGKTTKTREVFEEGAHCIGMNTSSIGVCFAGNFDATIPTGHQLLAWKNLYKKLQAQFPGIPIAPHRKYATKSCHGRLIGDDYFVLKPQSIVLLDKVEQLLNKLLSMISSQRT